MILIADSGSTKTSWVLADRAGKINNFNSSGINPYFHSSEQISESVRSEFITIHKINIKEISTVYFYGAGCSSPENIKMVRQGLQNVFEESEIFVTHDLLGASRALCGRQKGIAAILGTGSNSCVFDGDKIVHQVSSLGYVLGDEGSGAYLGKKFLSALIYKEFPTEISNRFYKSFPVNLSEILDHVYRKPNPNRYLASFCKFIKDEISNPYIEKLVFDSFHDFFKKQIEKYPDHRSIPVHSTGSIGFYFSDILQQVASERKIRLGLITQNPLDGLVQYHLEQSGR